MKLISFLLVLFFTVSCSTTPVNPEGKKLIDFFEAVHQEDLSFSPEYKAYLGIKEDMDKWSDQSEVGQTARLERRKNNLAKLRQFDFKALSDFDKVSYKIFEYDLMRDIEGFKWRYHYYPISHSEGPQTGVSNLLLNFHPIENEKMARDYIERLKKVPELFKVATENIDRSVKLGVIPPRYVFDKNIPMLENLLKGFPLTKEGEHVLYKDFKEKLGKAKLDQKLQEDLLKELETVLKTNYLAPHEKLYSYLLKLKSRAPKEGGSTKIAQGKDFYNFQLKFHTTTNLSAQEVHQIGLNEVKRIHSEMMVVAKTLSFKGNIQAFFKYMNERPDARYPNTKEGKEEYLKDATKTIEEMKKRLPELFTIFPKAEVVVKAVEPYREQAEGIAFYEGPSIDGTRPGVYYVNLFDMNSVRKYERDALAYHEGIPGHHMQVALAMEQKNLPSFRKNAWFTAYGEGWGLYSELIPKEIGLYQDPVQDFGRLSLELWRACRLVVDTGIHFYGWDIKKSMKYLLDNTPTSKHDAENSSIRYAMWPGQATAYKIGMMRIQEIREATKKVLKERFDLKLFHDEVIKNGNVPLPVLEEVIADWVGKQLEDKE
jgi:uncharacterized protein (DUF885 family)